MTATSEASSLRAVMHSSIAEAGAAGRCWFSSGGSGFGSDSRRRDATGRGHGMAGWVAVRRRSEIFFALLLRGKKNEDRRRSAAL